MSAPQPPKGLKAWGLSLWDGVCKETLLDAAGYIILAEACRTADIIEKLSGALASGSSEWVRLSEEAEYQADGAVKISIVVNPLLGEIRQQRLALRQLLAQLKLGSTKEDTAPESAIDQLIAGFPMPE